MRMSKEAFPSLATFIAEPKADGQFNSWSKLCLELSAPHVAQVQLKIAIEGDKGPLEHLEPQLCELERERHGAARSLFTASWSASVL